MARDIAKPFLHEFIVVGRKKPTEAEPKPKIYRMRLFARNAVVAKSRFWYFMRLSVKLKKANGEILECTRVFEKKPDLIKNYGIFFRYDSRTGTHNMYKEFRDVSAEAAVSKLCTSFSLQVVLTSIQMLRWLDNTEPASDQSKLLK